MRPLREASSANNCKNSGKRESNVTKGRNRVKFADRLPLGGAAPEAAEEPRLRKEREFIQASILAAVGAAVPHNGSIGRAGRSSTLHAHSSALTAASSRTCELAVRRNRKKLPRLIRLRIYWVSSVLAEA